MIPSHPYTRRDNQIQQVYVFDGTGDMNDQVDLEACC